MKKWWKDPIRRLEVGKKISQTLITKKEIATDSLVAFIEASPNYRLWKHTILKRDQYTCAKCGHKVHHKKKKKGIGVHHIKPLATILKEHNLLTIHDKVRALATPELFDLSNGIVLCTPCHKKEHTTNK